jgi:hypothetical protein
MGDGVGLNRVLRVYWVLHSSEVTDRQTDVIIRHYGTVVENGPIIIYLGTKGLLN